MKERLKKVLYDFLIVKIRECKSQKEAAEILQTTQPRMSALVNGKLDAFSVDSLLTWLGLFGYQVHHHIDQGMLMLTIVPTGENNATEL